MEIVVIKNVRCLGMDIISVSSYSHRSKARIAHKSFLITESGKTYPPNWGHETGFQLNTQIG